MQAAEGKTYWENSAGWLQMESSEIPQELLTGSWQWVLCDLRSTGRPGYYRDMPAPQGQQALLSCAALPGCCWEWLPPDWDWDKWILNGLKKYLLLSWLQGFPNNSIHPVPG